MNQTALLKPLTSDIKLIDPSWHDEDTISYYIPICFNPDDYFEGIHINNSDSDDYINLYLIYHCQNDTVELEIHYFSYFESEDKYSEINVILDKETAKYLRDLLSQEFEIIWYKRRKQ